MGKLSKEEFLKKVKTTPTTEPDEWDLKLLTEIDAETDSTTIPLETMQAQRECSGKIALRIPKELHYKLLKRAKANGVSLNQFLVYKLAE